MQGQGGNLPALERFRLGADPCELLKDYNVMMNRSELRVKTKCYRAKTLWGTVPAPEAQLLQQDQHNKL